MVHHRFLLFEQEFVYVNLPLIPHKVYCPELHRWVPPGQETVLPEHILPTYEENGERFAKMYWDSRVEDAQRHLRQNEVAVIVTALIRGSRGDIRMGMGLFLDIQALNIGIPTPEWWPVPWQELHWPYPPATAHERILEEWC